MCRSKRRYTSDANQRPKIYTIYIKQLEKRHNEVLLKRKLE